MERHRILFLYTELARYFLSCVNELGKSDWVEAVKVVHWPIHEEAPFEFGEKKAYSLLNKEALQGASFTTQFINFSQRPSSAQAGSIQITSKSLNMEKEHSSRGGI